MVKEKVSIYAQMFYFGIFHSLYSFLWMLFTNDFNYSLGYFLLCTLQAILFFMGHYFFFWSLKYIDLSKQLIYQYMKIVFVFLLGIIIFNETIFVTDLFGSIIIVGFMIYHIMNPIKKKPLK